MGRHAEHDTVEQWRSIDIRRWAREGSLQPGNSFGWFWSCEGKTTASISVHVPDPEQVRLVYRLTRDGQTRDFDYAVQLERTPCFLGGSRIWFRCPNCSRRTAKLYGPNNIFACRSCLRLNYACQRVAKRFRWSERAWALHRKAGSPFGPLDDAAELIRKPKWMRRKTFEHMIAGIVAADGLASIELAEGLQRLTQTSRRR